MIYLEVWWVLPIFAEKRREDMATIVLSVENEGMLNQLKKACQMLKGVKSVRVIKDSNTEADITTTAGYQEALDDIREGRVYRASSTEDMFEQILELTEK